jgi:hypothetical protein
MKKDNNKNQIEKNRNDLFVKTYLWIFLSYIASFFIGVIILIIEITNLGSQDMPVSFGGGVIFFAIFIFSLYNITSLIIIRLGVPKKILVLSISEFIFLILLLSILLLDVFSKIWLVSLPIIKIVQLVFVIHLLFKYKNNEKRK